jgi:hypothetical protein
MLVGNIQILLSCKDTRSLSYQNFSVSRFKSLTERGKKFAKSRAFLMYVYSPFNLFLKKKTLNTSFCISENFAENLKD